MGSRQPNVIFVFSDQHRWCDTGYNGNEDVRTPNLDRLHECSVDFTRAVSGMPVCCPYRASLMTGQYPMTHGVFMNDLCLNTGGPYLAECFRRAGYDTAYIGKWHIDGHGRESFIPPERHKGYRHWQVLECTHDYNHSSWFGDTPDRQWWKGYDAFAQTDAAIDYLRRQDVDHPFFLTLSWGPPHNPLETAPEEYRAMYDPAKLSVRPNVPSELADTARTELAGYYAHITALDDAFGRLWTTLRDIGLEKNTILIYTSDHGDMLRSQGLVRKQKPWEENIRVPFLLRWPAAFGDARRDMGELFDAPDILPTLLGLCGIPVPKTAEGVDFAAYLRGEQPGFRRNEAFLSCIQPFGEFTRTGDPMYGGGREYRGLRTKQYTYVRDRQGDWLFYDNTEDPYQMHNLVDDPAYENELRELRVRLDAWLTARGDTFRDGREYCAERGYILDETGTIPIRI